ncbi:hypothetical protein ACCO45_005545 [Purpureocillium lilacinum]|uniref:Uncharacterized protein n=1 Tax=Purpureocillium lilacinum TaxID=33203 RepID=A0ACC4DYT0_PURLI
MLGRSASALGGSSERGPHANNMVAPAVVAAVGEIPATGHDPVSWASVRSKGRVHVVPPVNCEQSTCGKQVQKRQPGRAGVPKKLAGKLHGSTPEQPKRRRPVTTNGGAARWTSIDDRRLAKPHLGTLPFTCDRATASEGADQAKRLPASVPCW